MWARGALLALDGKREQGEAEVTAALHERVTSDGRTLGEHVQVYLREQAARAAPNPCLPHRPANAPRRTDEPNAPSCSTRRS